MTSSSRRRGWFATLVVIAVAATIGRAPAAMAADGADPDHPAVVLTTPDGPVVLTLDRTAAPHHADAVLAALAAGHAERWRVDLVSPGGYVQLAAPDATELVGLAPEPDARASVRGAVVVYDGPDAVPTVVMLLADRPDLGDDYTVVGWVHVGIDRLDALARVPARPDGVPTPAVELGPLVLGDAATIDAARGSDGGVPVAAVVIMLIAASSTATIALVQHRLDRATASTLLLASALVGFFGAWTAAAPRTNGTPVAGMVLFVGALALFRVMGRFERPRADQGARRSITQPPPAAGQ